MQRVVITGGNSGMGKEAVRLFLEKGDKVVFTSRTTRLSEKTLEELKTYADNGQLHFLQADSSNAGDVEKLVKFTDEKIGGCDVLVNSAAIFIGGELHEHSEQDYDKLMDINVKGVFLTCKYFLPQMIAQQKGSIINISSVAGIRGGYNMAVYCASKAALENLTRCMAIDYGRKGVRANAICPSATQTKMFMTGTTDEIMRIFKKNNPMGRIGQPEEIAKAIVFLASDDARYINGQCIAVDGGLSAWNGEPRQDKTEMPK